MTDVHGGGLGTYWEGVRPAAVARGGDVRVALKVRVTRCYFALCWCCKQLLIPCVAGTIRVLCIQGSLELNLEWTYSDLDNWACAHLV